MRHIILGLGIAVAALTAATQTIEAQTPHGSRPFCTSGNRADGGMPSCSYYTWEQCRAALSGGDHCYANPSIGWSQGQNGTPQGKKKQRPSY
jgi:hypothetical protein